jgi:signal transduction histidine kinase
VSDGIVSAALTSDDEWWESAPTGLIELSSDGAVLRINRLGREILGLHPGGLHLQGPHLEKVCSALVEAISDRSVDDHERTLEWATGSGQSGVLAYRVRRGRHASLVAFRDVTTWRVQQRRVAAVAATAASVASERSLLVSLNALAREVARADGLAGVQILATDADHTPGFRVMGSAGFPYSDEFFDLLVQCRDRGASLKMLEAYETLRPVVVRRRYRAVMADPAWAPLWDHLREPEWDSFASVPLIANGRPVGVLNAFFSPTQEISDDVLDFLVTMADQAALAIDYATLLERNRDDAGRAERQKLARELHDSVVQQVFSIGMQTEALKLLCARGDQPNWARVAPVAQELEAMTRSVLADLRSLVSQLHPAAPTTDGLRSALSEFVAATRRRSGIDVTLSCPASVENLDKNLCEDVYYVIAEAVHNALKHAEADVIDIAVSHDAEAGRLLVDVVDDGCGRRENSDRPGGGYGLISMGNRAERWGGTLTVESGPSGGTRVSMSVPASGGSPAVININGAWL